MSADESRSPAAKAQQATTLVPPINLASDARDVRPPVRAAAPAPAVAPALAPAAPAARSAPSPPAVLAPAAAAPVAAAPRPSPAATAPAALVQAAGPAIQVLRAAGLLEDVLQLIAAHGLTTHQAIMQAHMSGLAAIGVKKGSQLKIISHISAAVLPGEDPRVKVTYIHASCYT